MPKDIMNVGEPWILYDTILICSDCKIDPIPKGWFTSFTTAGVPERHSFFKGRTESLVGLEYCNQQSGDTMDYAFELYSMGLTCFVPSINIGVELVEGSVSNIDFASLHSFQFDLLRHCSIQLKVNQDIIAELTGYLCPPGYGAIGGGGAALENNNLKTQEFVKIPTLKFSGTQGIPVMTNRWKLKSPIGIPRTATIEGILDVAEYGRSLLTAYRGPWNYLFNQEVKTSYPMACGIQLSLLGKRLVQQRGQYHR